MRASLVELSSNGALARRAATVPALFVIALLVTVSSPALVLIAAGVDLARRRGAATLRVLAFCVTYLASEVVGVLALGGAWIRKRRDRRALLSATYAIQGAWTRALLEAVRRIFSLRFDVSGDASVRPGPVIVLCRHASIIDTLLPSVFLTARHGVRLRFVLKEELLWDPCLDIAGSRLPNHFVSRTAEGSAADLQAIEQLARDLADEEGVMIFPEGTRFSKAKRARAISRLEERDPALASVARRLEHTLPPKLGGVTALLRGAPTADLLLLAHAGLEGFSHVRDIWRGALYGKTVRVRAWRIARAEVPADLDAQRRFITEQWCELDRKVGELSAP